MRERKEGQMISYEEYLEWKINYKVKPLLSLVKSVTVQMYHLMRLHIVHIVD